MVRRVLRRHWRTVAGYELCAVGANPKAAATAGVDVKRVIVRAMSVSGALSVKFVE